MRILYFSKDYSPHDHRFLSALAETEHEVFYLKLERNLRQTEDRPVPSQIQQILWKGGQGPFRWRDAPSLTLNLKRVIKEIKPDLISRRSDSNLCVSRGSLRLSSYPDDVLGF